MKNRNTRIVVLQAVLVLLMSATASYSLYSNIGLWTLLVFTGMLVIGALTLIFPRTGTLPFSLLTIAASLISILSYSVIDIGVRAYKGYGTGANIYWEDTEPLISFSAILAIGIFLISGYVALSFLNTIAQDYRNMTSGGVEISEIERVTGKNLGTGGMLLAAGIIVSVVFVVILRLIQPGLSEYLVDYPWSIAVIGTIAVLILGGFIYWMATRKKPSIDEK